MQLVPPIALLHGTTGIAAAASAISFTQRNPTGLFRKPLRVSETTSLGVHAGRPALWKAMTGPTADAFSSGGSAGAPRFSPNSMVVILPVSWARRTCRRQPALPRTGP
jgi:hypothetical protein